MKKLFMGIFAAFVLFSLIFCDISSISAQEAEFTLEEITVTAEKREENVQKTSMSLSIVTEEEIMKRSLTTIDDMLRNVVGLGIAGQGQSARIFIRGIGADGGLDTAFTDSPVSLIVDGVQQQRSVAISNTMMDVERVEVLRGPQGTLYGRNAIGGAVNVVTVQPRDYFEAMGKVQGGNYNSRNYQAVINIPVYNKLALRISGAKDSRDTYTSGGDANGFIDKASARMKAQFKFNEDLTVIGTIDYSRDKSNGAYSSTDPNNLDSDDPWHNPTSTSISGSRWVEAYNYNMQINWNIKDLAKFTFIPTYMTNDVKAAGQIGAGGPPERDPHTEQWTYEAHFSNTEDSKIIWTLGTFFYESGIGETEYADDTASPDPRIRFLLRPTKSQAIFGQTTYPFSETLRVVAGLRYTKDDKTLRYKIYQTTEPDEDGNWEYIYDSGAKKVPNKNSKATWKLGVEYDLAESSMGYFSIATGYKSGGVSYAKSIDENFELVNIDAAKFEQENSISYELGSKNRFLSDRLQVNGALFYTDYDNAQVQMTVNINTGTEYEENMTLIRNAGDTFMYGAEVETTWLITAKDRLTVGISSMKGEYNDLVIESDSPAWLPVQTHTSYDISGAEKANMPRFHLNLNYQHTWDFGEYGTLATTFDGYYKTKYYNSMENYVPGALVPAHHISNFYLNWASPKGKWAVNGYIKNIEKKAIALRAMSRGGTGQVSLNEPRTFGLSLTVRY